MRIDIDDDATFEERYFRSTGRKIVGRKHNHRGSSRFNECKRAAAKRLQQNSRMKISKYKLLVAKFWRGELDEFPQKDF